MVFNLSYFLLYQEKDCNHFQKISLSKETLSSSSRTNAQSGQTSGNQIFASLTLLTDKNSNSAQREAKGT